MTCLEALLGAYLQANVLLAVALVVWTAVMGAARCAGFSLSAALRQRLLRLAILSAVLSPLFLSALSLATGSRTLSLDPVDSLIAAYLSGWVALSLSEVEAIVAAARWSADLPIRLNGLLFGLPAVALVAGMCVLLIRLGRHLVVLRRHLGRCHAWRRTGRTRLVVSDTAGSPFAARSLRHRYIVLPTRLLGAGRELRLAIAHEAQHLRNGDVEWAFLLEGLTVLFFWNPAFIFWRREAERLRELACDRAVLARRGTSAEAYCAFLLRMGEGGFRSRGTVFVPGLLGRRRRGERLLRRRIVALLGRSETVEPWLLGGLAALVLVGAIGLVSLIVQPPGEASALELHLAMLSNLDRFAEREVVRSFSLVMSY